MMSELSKQVIIITGAGSGIGKATAIKLSSLGATLALTDINEENLKTTLAECQPAEATTKAHGMWTVDVKSTSACNQLVADVVAKYGAIHHVFNCAGINPTLMDTEKIPDEYWQALVDTNLKGVFNLTRAALPHMQSGSSFVNTSSTAGTHPTAGMAVYCATKYAVVGFSKCVALEVGSRGIRVNVIAPGSIITPTNLSVVEGSEGLNEAIGLKRLGKPEEVAEVVAFLFSEKARYMNGSVVEIDGGVGLTW